MDQLHKICVLSLLSFIALSAGDPVKPTTTDNPNVWNFQIARRVIAAFQFNGMGMSIWEDQGVENTTIVSRRQFYVTPITELLPNETKCEYNVLTGASFVSYKVQVWNDRLQLAAIDRLKQMQIDVAPQQVQPLPFYQVRVTWNNAQQKLKKATLSDAWISNLQQQSIHRFTILIEDKATCETFAETLKTTPEFFSDNVVLEYSLSATSTASRILTVKAEHFINSQLMATLSTMDITSPERYLTADDANRLTLQVMDNVVATQVVDGDYVPDTEQLTMKDAVANVLQMQNVDTGNFTQKMWESVFWDPAFARPDKVTSYLNKVLNINQGNHSVNKSNQYSEKSDDSVDFGISDLFSIKGGSKGESSNSASFSELNAWLLQHNYDVEIKGNIFISKSLFLKRVNLGVLKKQETIFTKSVQMHHVDAPGTLKVTVGSKSIMESEDIKSLRNRLDNLEPRVGQVEGAEKQFEGKTGQLEARMGQVEGAEKQLEARMGQVEGAEKQLEGRTGQVEARMGQVEGKSGQLDGRTGQLEGRMIAMEGRFHGSGWTISCYLGESVNGEGRAITPRKIIGCY